MKLRNRLKSIRHKHEMNQTEFAAFLGVGREIYNRWERNERQPDLQSTWKLLKRLKISIEELFCEQEE